MPTTPANSRSLSIQADVIKTLIDTPGSHFDMIQEGPFATVSRVWTSIEDGVPQWVAVKSSTTFRKFAREPHDIVKELRLLGSMMHPNIVSIIGSFRDEEQHLLSIYMPYFPLCLSTILASPYFSPHLFPPLPPSGSQQIHTHTDSPTLNESSVNTHHPQSQEILFVLLSKSIMLQTLDALAFLHDPIRLIGHRDIKPENIMLTRSGCVKLIDFGVSWRECEADIDKSHDLWPEYIGKLYFEVSTRAYRAPELLFGTRAYDQCAVDLWSLGATFVEFFRPLRLVSDEEDDGDDDDDGEDDNDGEESQEEESNIQPFIVPRYLRIGYPGAQWKRDTLFNGERGEIGLAWSIFKIFGTPDEKNWPEFEHLPGATSVVFNVVPKVPLVPLCPNLPPSYITPKPPSAPANGIPATSELKPTPELMSTPTLATSTALDLISSFLVYPSSKRLRAEDAMRHPWFTGSLPHPLLPPSSCPLHSHHSPPQSTIHSTSPESQSQSFREMERELSTIILPLGYALEREFSELRPHLVDRWRGRTMEDLLGEVVKSN